ncbi:MAG: glycoside hydrolase family 88 protein, partial [Treponema sp.]|nr:glycoside hydrolase family 88 protein [Treponema sp.]
KVKFALLGMQRYSWEQGVSMQAFLEQGDMDLVVLLAKDAVNRQTEDGRAANIGEQGAVTDPVSILEGLRSAVNYTGDSELEKGYDKLLEWALHTAPRNRKGVLYHVEKKPQIWVDSMYMLPPSLAAAGYYREALLNLYGYWDVLFDEDKKLLSHIWDDGSKTFIRRAFWGVGNGWTLGGLARVYDLLPEKFSEDKAKIANMATSVINSLLALVRPDGLFHDVVDDPSTFVETNCSQMLVYAIYRGLKSKWLNSSYLEPAEKLRTAVHGRVDAYGLVQGVCGAPHFDHPGTAPEGQAFYILMEAAAGKYYA